MATTPRLFVSSTLKPGAQIALAESQAHYLTRVLRLGLGAEVRVFNGRDGEWLAEVDQVGGRRVALIATTQRRTQASPATAPTLLFAPLKKTRTDFAVEKATELGAHRIAPVITERTQTKTVRTDRLRALAMEAAEQTERMDLPVVDDALPLRSALSDWPDDEPIFFADEAGDATGEPWGGQTGRAPTLLNAIAKRPSAKAGLLVGPEGGFTPAERVWLRSQSFVTPVSLGPRILRAETAIVAALTLWQAAAGDWRDVADGKE